MKIYIRRSSGIATQKINDTAPLQRLEMKRGDTVHLFCVFTDDNGVPVQLPPGATGAFVAKQAEHYTDAPLFGALGWTRMKSAADGYRFDFPVASTALTALLGQKASAVLMGEVTWFLGGKTHSTQTISITCANDVYRDDDPPVPAPGSAWPSPETIALKSDVAEVAAQMAAPRAFLDLVADDGSVWRQTLVASVDGGNKVVTPTWTLVESPAENETSAEN